MIKSLVRKWFEEDEAGKVMLSLFVLSVFILWLGFVNY